MRTIVHLGPHKTGTTSLQAALAEAFSCRAEGRPWYPTPAKAGPGHFQLCQSLESGSVAELFDYVKAARDARCSALVISSEDLCKLNETKFARLLRKVEHVAFELVFTLSPVVRRGLSMWKEQVKHGATRPLAGAAGAILRTRSLSFDLVARFARASPDLPVSVVMSDPDERELLFRNFAELLGFPGAFADGPGNVLNKGLGELEIELIRTLNRECRQLRITGERRWACMDVLAKCFSSPEWAEVAPERSMRLPAELESRLSSRAKESFDSIQELAAAGRVSILGDASRLMAPLGAGFGTS